MAGALTWRCRTPPSLARALASRAGSPLTPEVRRRRATPFKTCEQKAFLSYPILSACASSVLRETRSLRTPSSATMQTRSLFKPRRRESLAALRRRRWQMPRIIRNQVGSDPPVGGRLSMG